MDARLIELLEGGKKKRKVSAHAKKVGALRRQGYSMAQAQAHIRSGKGIIGGDFVDDEFDDPADTKLRKDSAKFTRKQLLNELEVAQKNEKQKTLEKDRILGPALIAEKRAKALLALKRALKKIENDEYMTQAQKDVLMEKAGNKYKTAVENVQINSVASFQMDTPVYKRPKAVVDREAEILKIKALVGITGEGRKKKARK